MSSSEPQHPPVQPYLESEEAEDRANLRKRATAAAFFACAAAAILPVTALHIATQRMDLEYSRFFGRSPPLLLQLRWVTQGYIEVVFAGLVFFGALVLWRLRNRGAQYSLRKQRRAFGTAISPLVGAAGSLISGRLALTFAVIGVPFSFFQAILVLDDVAQIVFNFGVYATLILGVIYYRRMARRSLFEWKRSTMTVTFGVAIAFESLSLLATIVLNLSAWRVGFWTHQQHEWSDGQIVVQFLAFTPLGLWFFGYHRALRRSLRQRALSAEDRR
jgi:hypothetical protein